MSFYLYLLLGFLGGVPAGMGMGGGTVLIPALIVFLSVPQHTAQAINLVTFIPMAISALIFHIKNKLVKVSDLLWLIIPAVAFAVLASYVASIIKGEVLKKVFGGFLIALSVLQFFSHKIAKKVNNLNEK